MIKSNLKSEQQKSVKLAGVMYLLTILTAILSMIMIDSKLNVSGDMSFRMTHIIENIEYLRMSVAYELFFIYWSGCSFSCSIWSSKVSE